MQSRRALFSYQREGVDWMKVREKDPNNLGGILAEEMGMGLGIRDPR